MAEKKSLTRVEVSEFLTSVVEKNSIMKTTIAEEAKVNKVQVSHALGDGYVSNNVLIRIAKALGYELEMHETIKGKSFILNNFKLP